MIFDRDFGFTEKKKKCIVQIIHKKLVVAFQYALVVAAAVAVANVVTVAQCYKKNLLICYFVFVEQFW